MTEIEKEKLIIKRYGEHCTLEQKLESKEKELKKFKIDAKFFYGEIATKPEDEIKEKQLMKEIELLKKQIKNFDDESKIVHQEYIEFRKKEDLYIPTNHRKYLWTIEFQ